MLAINQIARIVDGLTAGVKSKADVTELFGPGRFTSEAIAFKLLPGTAFDLRTGWDLSQERDQQRCWQQLHAELPEFIVGSPMCAPFSTAMAFRNYDTEATQKTLKNALIHLRFCVGVYGWQLERHKYFLHEQPWAASSWYLNFMQELVSRDYVYIARGDQCMFGQKVIDGGETLPARKRTGWLTNLAEVARAVGVKCDGSHKHSKMEGGRVTRQAERYPPKLVRAILAAVRLALRKRRGSAVNAVEAGTHIDEDPPEAKFDFSHLDNAKIYDQYTGVALEVEKVAKARTEELDFAAKLGAWETRTKVGAYARMGRAPFPVGWIDHNKGDNVTEDYRSRMVVKETKRVSTIASDDIAAVTSSTPPLEGIRLFLCAAMTWASTPDDPYVMQFLDISRTHPHIKPLRDNIYIEGPKELGLAVGECLLLLRSWYGARDASQAFEYAVRDAFLKRDFVVGIFSVCIFRHVSKPLVYLVHGDDFAATGTTSQLKWLGDKMRSKYDIQMDISGP